MNERILVIEDELELCISLGDRLRSEGYAVEFEHDGNAGMKRAVDATFHLIILDLMLPLRSGFDVCTGLRRIGVHTPILLLTARSQTTDKVVGLKLGADDYVTKPFDTHELMARIEALLRRSVSGKSVVYPGDRDTCQIGDMFIDLRSGKVTRADKQVELTTREFQLLRFLIEHRGSIVTRDQLLREVWGHEPGTVTRTVDVHMASLRQKLERTPRRPDYLITVAGAGYKLQE